MLKLYPYLSSNKTHLRQKKKVKRALHVYLNIFRSSWQVISKICLSIRTNKSNSLQYPFGTDEISTETNLTGKAAEHNIANIRIFSRSTPTARKGESSLHIRKNTKFRIAKYACTSYLSSRQKSFNRRCANVKLASRDFEVSSRPCGFQSA